MPTLLRFSFPPWNWVRSSFRAKLTLAFFCIISLFLIAIYIIYYQRSKTEIEQNTYDNLDHMAEQTVSSIQMYMENIHNVAWGYFSDTGLQDFLVEMNEKGVTNFTKVSYYHGKLDTTLVFNTFIGTIALYDMNGHGILTSGSKEFRKNMAGAHDRRLEIPEKEALIKLAVANEGREDWQVTHSMDFTSTPGKYTLSYVQALKKITLSNQRIVGVLRISLVGDELIKRLQDMKIKNQGLFYVVDREGRIILAEDPHDIGRSLKKDPWYQTYRRAGQLTSRLPVGRLPAGHFMYGQNGNQWLSVYHRFSKEDWALIGKIPLSVVMTGVAKTGRDTLTIGIFSLIIALLLAFLISTEVTQPIHKLREAMVQLGKGNFDAAVQVRSTDEIGFLGTSFNTMAQEIRRLINKVYEAELLKKEAEIEALQSQINPHFLYNALGMIDSLASLQGDKRVGLISRALSNIFRYSISGGQYATVLDEINQVKQYLAIQQLRFEERLTYQIDVEPELSHFLMPKLVLQPLVENAINHGLERKREQGRILIRVSSDNEKLLRITVTDDGVGMDEAECQRVKELLQGNAGADGQQYSGGGERRISIGLANVSRRIRLFNNDQYGLTISSEPGAGTRVALLLPKVTTVGV